MLGKREGMGDAPPRESGGKGSQDKPASQPAPQATGSGFNDFEDDIPF
jgi:hypothetical protein